MEAIRQTKVDMKVWLGNYVIPEDSTPYERQKQAIKAALEEYGTDHVGGVTVGNEFMLKYESISVNSLLSADNCHTAGSLVPG